MLKRFAHNLLKNFCIYLLAVLNLVHAIQRNSYDWLLWTSLVLCGLSILLALLDAKKGK